MCPTDQDSEEAESGAADDAPGDAGAAAQPCNTIIGPLTDDELRTGGMKGVMAFMRTERSKASLRKERHRKKHKAAGKRQINVSVGDDDRSRATIRGAATAIGDEAFHQAIELLLADEELRPLVVGLGSPPELRELVNLILEAPARKEAIGLAKLVITRPEIAALIQRVTATKRTLEAVEIAAANPEFAFFGSKAATERSICAWLARLLLRVRKIRAIDHDR
ncbi:MAG: hypothetical protein BGP05_03950 [Rhizobiales bacterium 62-47]|nr:hypothetical protein [Hyphomicrobiales bacterium]MBN9041754.1 hypothetical protein [Hyphomicrobiales bacterium]OJY13064.1 MAG: hypothetical protein BGP05_03950 [Rhizobiales bacterium 62-47]